MQLPGSKSEVIVAISNAAVGADLAAGETEIVKGVECLFIWADPAKGESFPSGANGYVHSVAKKDKIYSMVVPAKEKRYYTELNGSKAAGFHKDGSPRLYNFHIEPVILDLDLSFVEAHAVKSELAFLDEVLVFAQRKITVRHPRSGAPRLVRPNGLDDVLIFPDGFLEKFGDEFDEKPADPPAESPPAEAGQDVFVQFHDAPVVDKRCVGILKEGKGRCTRNGTTVYHGHQFCQTHTPPDEKKFHDAPQEFIHDFEGAEV